LKGDEFQLLGIDGTDGSGKTTLAASLSEALGCPHINLDDHIDKNKGQYVNHVHYPTVKEIIDSAHSQIIIEGVCLLAIAERLKVNFDALIYVKRIASYGDWRDEDDCNVTEDIEEFMKRKKEDLNKFVHADAYLEGKDFPDDTIFPELAEEIIRYHHTYRPHERADFIFRRID
jgi:uridine kinase